MKVNETNYETLYKAMNITGTDYNIKWFDKNTYDGYIDELDILSMIDDLISEIDYLNEKIEDLEQDIESNYKPIPVAEQYEISERDFY